MEHTNSDMVGPGTRGYRPYGTTTEARTYNLFNTQYLPPDPRYDNNRYDGDEEYR